MDGSASIRETQLALHFRISRKRGGNGIGIPDLNYEIPLEGAMRKRAGQGTYYVDQYWPGYQLAVEYESDEFHHTKEDVARDRKRRNLLQDLGFRVITVNTKQLTNVWETDDIARQILRHMHKRQKDVADPVTWNRKHLDFHNELLRVDGTLHL